MALFHFWQVAITFLFGGFSWVLCRYLILLAHNMYVTEFPMYAALPHVGFMLSIGQWGLWLMVMLPMAFYLWNQTLRPEVN